MLRRSQQDLKELKELQIERKKAEEEQKQARKTAAPKTLAAASGFEFTNTAEQEKTEEKSQAANRSLPLAG